MKKSFQSQLASYVDALYPIVYINHFDFSVIDRVLLDIGENVNIIEFNIALGIVDFNTKIPISNYDLEKFLISIKDKAYEKQTFIVLKDVHSFLNEPRVISILKRIVEDNLYRESYNCTIFIISSTVVIPKELENYITVLDIELPTSKEILDIIVKFTRIVGIKVNDDTMNDIALSLKGLNEFQIKQILSLAYQDGGYINEKDKLLILREKEQIIKKAGMLEIVNFEETIDDIGGLDNLKEWLTRKAHIFKNLDRAIKFGVDTPKGIMIIGMPGCGKSLTAKATAKLLEVPLVRLDVGRFLGTHVGESAENMRNALKLSEAISPCVLWIDEVEKAFAGGCGNDMIRSEVTTRLFGQFLTWMQEKDDTVFIVATANDISTIPAEFLRKGRFDELFSVDLPNNLERRKILEIHLKKRNKLSREIDTIKLIKPTVGFNGADLEAVVKDSIEYAFINNQAVTTELLLESIKNMKSISITLKDKLEEIRKTLNKIDIKHASKSIESGG